MEMQDKIWATAFAIICGTGVFYIIVELFNLELM